MLNNSARNTMNLSRCPDVLNQLPAYVEGELTALEAARVNGHLSLCGACRREEQALHSTLCALHTPIRVTPPGDIYALFTAKVVRFEASPWRRPATVRWAATACCLFLVVGVGALVNQTSLFGNKPKIEITTPSNTVNSGQAVRNADAEKPNQISESN